MRRVFLVAVGSCFAASHVWAAAGLTSGEILRRTLPAKPAGFGEAYVGMSGDIDSIQFNPGAMARLEHPSISTTYQHGFVEDNFGSLEYAHPLPFGSVYMGGSYFDAGTIDINQSDGTQGTRRAEQDMLGVIGVAVGKNFPVSAGINGKFFRSDLAETAQATGSALDAGVHWRTPVYGLGFGAAVQNVGSDLQYENAGDPLPRTFRFGISYVMDLQEMKVLKTFPYTFHVLVDGVNTKDEQTGVHAGLEVARRLAMFDTEGSAALRGGYRSDAKSGDVGIGFVIGNFSIDYAIHLINDLDPSHRVTLGYRFLPKAKKSLESKSLGGF